MALIVMEMYEVSIIGRLLLLSGVEMKKSIVFGIFILLCGCLIGTVNACPAGTYLQAGPIDSCPDCHPGHYCPGNDAEIECAIGTFVDNWGQVTCEECSAATEPGMTFCPPCIDGYKLNAVTGVGIPGYPIKIQAPGLYRSAPADENGFYSFCTLPKGEYTVCEWLIDGWTPVGDPCITVVLEDEYIHHDFVNRPSDIPAPEFPSMLLPATMIIGFLGAVLLIQRTREH